MSLNFKRKKLLMAHEINLPFIVINVAFSIERHSLRNIDQLPDGHETYVAVTGGKLVPISFWVHRGDESVDAYDPKYVKSKIAEELSPLITSNSQANLTGAEMDELVGNLLKCLAGTDGTKVALEGVFFSSSNIEDEKVATLYIPHWRDRIEVNVYKGTEVPKKDSDKSFLGVLQKLVGGPRQEKKKFEQIFQRNGVDHVAVFDFPAYEYGDWFNPSALSVIVNDAIDTLMRELISSLS